MEHPEMSIPSRQRRVGFCQGRHGREGCWCVCSCTILISFFDPRVSTKGQKIDRPLEVLSHKTYLRVSYAPLAAVVADGQLWRELRSRRLKDRRSFEMDCPDLFLFRFFSSEQ